MKVLWICNIMLPAAAEYLHKEASNKEGWLTGLSDTILSHKAENDIELAVAFPVSREEAGISFQVPVNGGAALNCFGFWEDTAHPEREQEELCGQIKKIIEEVRPDVVHCFGTEYPHTLAAAKVCEGKKILIGIQGLCRLCAQVYFADLPERVVRRVTLRDFLRRDSIRAQKKKFIKRGEQEQKAIERAGHITGRTWMDLAYTKDCNPRAKYHFMNETLRKNFYEGQWSKDACEKHSIFLSQGDYPIKGLHYMLKAMPLILKEYPDTKVYVAGSCIVKQQTFKDKLKISSYGKYLLELQKKYELQDKVIYLGKLNEEEMKTQFLKSHLYVCPSAIENSPNSLGEAMLLGMPCVTAMVGGIKSVFTEGRDGIAYPGYGDAVYEDAKDKEQAQAEKLAEAVLEMWSEEAKLKRYTRNAREHARKTHDGFENYLTLIDIYREIAEGSTYESDVCFQLYQPPSDSAEQGLV